MIELENEQKISSGSKTSPGVSFWIRLFVLPLFETKNVQSVRFCNQKRTRQLLNWKLNKASDFEIKVFQNHRFSKKNTFKKSRFASFRSMKTTIFANFSCFLKGSILNSKLYNVSDIELTENTTCQILFKNFTTFRTLNQTFSPRHSFWLVEELLQKLQPSCSRYQHVNCLYTLFKYRVSRNFVAKSGEVFDNVQRGAF